MPVSVAVVSVTAVAGVVWTGGGSAGATSGASALAPMASAAAAPTSGRESGCTRGFIGCWPSDLEPGRTGRAALAPSAGRGARRGCGRRRRGRCAAPAGSNTSTAPLSLARAYRRTSPASRDHAALRGPARRNGRVVQLSKRPAPPRAGRRPAASEDGGRYGWVVVPVLVCGACCGACCCAGAVAVVGWVFGPFLQSAVVKPLRQLVSAFQRLR